MLTWQNTGDPCTPETVTFVNHLMPTRTGFTIGLGTQPLVYSNTEITTATDTEYSPRSGAHMPAPTSERSTRSHIATSQRSRLSTPSSQARRAPYIEATKIQPLYALAAPLMLQLTECALSDPPTIIAPITFGPGSLYAFATLLADPNSLLGHSTRHIFDGAFHIAGVPFVHANWMHSAHCAAHRNLPRDEPATDLRPTTERRAQPVRLPAKNDSTTCVIFIDACEVSYRDLGALVRECIQ